MGVRYIRVQGLIRQKDGRFVQETHIRAIPEGVEPEAMGLPRRGHRVMERAPGEFETPNGSGYELDTEAKARADEAAKLARMSRVELVAYILERAHAR